MPPVNKKKDLIVKNLASILSEVRKLSLGQLFDLPGVPVEEKIAHFRNALNDSEEIVQKTAEILLGKLGQSANPTPPKQFPPQPPPAVSVPLPVKAPVESPSPIPEPELPVSTPEPEPAPTPPRVDTMSIEAPPLNEEMDPSLPNIEALKMIPQRLDHIKFLNRERPSGHIRQLLDLACDQIEEIALTSLQTLLKLKDPRVPPQVLPFMNVPGFSSQRRFLILKIIMETKSNLELPHIEHILLNEKDVIVKSGLVKVFARFAGEDGVATLKRCLFDPDPRVRANTVEVVEEQGIRGCDSEIVKLLNDPENRVKVNTAKYLVKQGHAQAFSTLKSMLGSSEVWLRDSVIFALGEIGDQSSLTLLKAALKDPNQGIRLSVLKAMAKINNSSSREALQGMEKDPDPVVGQVARGLWEKIKNTPISPLKALPAAVAQTLPPTPPKAATPDGTIPEPHPVSSESRSADSEPLTLPSLEVVPVMQKPIPEPSQKAPPPPSHPPVEQPISSPSTTVSKPASASTPAHPLDGAHTPEKPVMAHVFGGSPPPLGVIHEQPVSHPPPAEKPVFSAPPPPLPKPDPHPEQIPTVASPATPSIPAQNTPSAPAQGVSGNMPQFQKPRSGEIYSKLISGNPDLIQAGMRDLPFIAGEDQNLLLQTAVKLSDGSSRLAAAKVLSRKRGPVAINMMRQLANDDSEIVRTFAQKALTLMK